MGIAESGSLSPELRTASSTRGAGVCASSSVSSQSCDVLAHEPLQPQMLVLEDMDGLVEEEANKAGIRQIGLVLRHEDGVDEGTRPTRPYGHPWTVASAVQACPFPLTDRQ